MTAEEITAYGKGGFREKYAMDNGTKKEKNMNGHIIWIYKYNASDKYQDANGATYDLTNRRWIG